MSELKPEKVPQVKEEEIEHSPIVQNPPEPLHSQPNSTIQPCFLDFQSMINNPFENQINCRLNWVNTSPFGENYQHFYGFADPYFRNPGYQMNSYPNYPNKPYEQTLSLTPTAASTAPNPYIQGVSYMPYQPPIQTNLPIIQPNSFWMQGAVQMDQSSSPSVKVQYDSSLERELGRKRLKSKMKNETKNIPKNYGKAMITFILSHLDWIQSEFGIERREELVSELKKRKNSINAIVHLKDLWTSSRYAKEFRILSNLFLRKYSFSYIFNSRVSNYSTHIKYKYKLQEALRSPCNFIRIKEY